VHPSDRHLPGRDPPLQVLPVQDLPLQVLPVQGPVQALQEVRSSSASTVTSPVGCGIVGQWLQKGRFGNVLVRSDAIRPNKRKWQDTAENQQLGPLLRGEQLKTAKALREQENTERIGGLRNPNAAVAKSAPLRATGHRIRKVLSKFLEKEDRLQVATLVVQSIGKPGCKGFPDDLVVKARRALAEEFGSVFPEPGVGASRSQFQSNLWETLIKDAQDPDTHIIGWMRSGCPTGAKGSTINTCGVFPPATAVSSAVEAPRTFASLMAGATWGPHAHRNYKSYYVSEGVHSATEVERIKSRGFIEVLAEWTSVIARWPSAQASKVALIIKERADRSLKLRFVVDLLRSGINGEADIPERVVLPRVSDFANSVVDLLAYPADADKSVELFTMDFTDAFYTLWLREADRGSLVFRVAEGWAVFRRLCFGMAGAPLIWGRLAASACRLGQACFRPEELRLQCYVDDPASAVRGSAATRDRLIAILLLLWCAMGFGLSWEKGARGSSVPWIGATFTLGHHAHPVPDGRGYRDFPGVAVTVQHMKFEELRTEVDKIHRAKGLIPVKQVLRVAGQLAWVSDFFPWIKGFISCLWAALADHTSSVAAKRAKVSDKKRPTHLMFAKRIGQAIACTRLLLAGLVRDRDGQPLVLERWYTVAQRLPSLQTCVRTDASPFGMGAVLFQFGWPIAWIALDWSEEDLFFLQAQKGDPAWQAEWELFAVLIAVDTWLANLKGQSTFLMQTDATAALFAAARLAGRTPAMNVLAVELAVRLESAQVGLAPEHLRGTLNVECDALSRLSQGAKVPDRLRHVPRSSPKPRSQAFFWVHSLAPSTKK